MIRRQLLVYTQYKHHLPALFAGYMALCFLLTAALTAEGQERDRLKTQEYIQQQEQLRRSVTMREYDSAVLLLEQGEFEKADEKFKYVLANLKSIPSDLTFQFGKNSFFMEQYKQSIDWLNKYIQLKGTNGQFSVEAIDLKKKAEVEFLKERSQSAQNIEDVLSSSFTIDCGPTGKVVCPVCRGEHVIIKKGLFQNEYRTCPYCNEHGTLTCDEYNQLIRGELKPKL
jgi:tetratricopeptide (TPR) repeat protein